MGRHDLFPEFEEFRVDTDGARIHGVLGGTGPPVLLLHGFPQTHAMWHPVAVRLAERHTVVLTDLRGYGDSVATAEDFTFRAFAADQHTVMRSLGFDRFVVVAHDRGARTAHRMALDHGTAVERVALLDILPTLDVWRLMNEWLAYRYYHWTFLAQPGGLAERLIAPDPVYYLRHALGGLGGSLDAFHPAALAEYERCARLPGVVHAFCADYTAAATTDLEHDRADAGRVLDLPALILWGASGVVGAQEDPLDVWGATFTHVTGHAIDAGHFLVEERPDEVHAALAAFLAGP